MTERSEQTDKKSGASELGDLRAGRCAIVGRPNVGKSTLMNALLGQKLAIATSRPQTTRNRILGVYSQEQPATQIGFLDTPGLHRPKNALGRALVEEAQGALVDSDVILVVIEAPTSAGGGPELNAGDRQVLELLDREAPGVVLAINKVDRLKDKAALLPWLSYLDQQFPFRALVPISALKQRGLEPLIAELRKHLPEGALYEDNEFVTDRPERFFVAELVREAAIHLTRQEVPYAVAVVVDSFVEDGNLTRIQASVVVEKPAQKKILIGKGGSKLKEIGTRARLGVEEMLQRKVFLGLWVKVVPDWTNNPSNVRELAMGADR